ncbi:hypothetical protein ACJJTC_010240 [Scirpophaga incertulas]
MADKIAVWIDDVLVESDDRMLMMDLDEDDDVCMRDDSVFTDAFLNMMGGGDTQTHPPAYLLFTGQKLEAFMVLVNSMENKGDENLITFGKCSMTYKEGVNELKRTPDFEATEYLEFLAEKLRNDLFATVKPNILANLEQSMNDVVDICSKYLAQYAEYTKDKGPAFKLLIKTMTDKGNEQLYKKGKVKKAYIGAATVLNKSKDLDTDHDDPDLSKAIYSNLSNLVEATTPKELKQDMDETLDKCSKFLSQIAVDEIERGPAFDILIKELEKHGNERFTPQYETLSDKFNAAYILKSAPGLSSSVPDPATVQVFEEALHAAVDTITPYNLKSDMAEVIGRCSNYLSAFVRDRSRAMEILLKTMQSEGKKVLVKRNNYTMDNINGKKEIESAPVVIPLLPVKDVADEIKVQLEKEVAASTPTDLNTAMKSLVQDVSKYLSQAVSLKSKTAGLRYPLDLLTATMKSIGSKPLYKHKALGVTYDDAAKELKQTETLDQSQKPENEVLKNKISTELSHGVPKKLNPTLTQELTPTITDASNYLAKVGSEKGEALDYMVKLMNEKGDAPLEKIQGYMQTYNDGARRIVNSNSLNNDKVDKEVQQSLKNKLTELTNVKPIPKYTKILPGVIEDSSKFLATSFPENEDEKRHLLADLMARKDDDILAQDRLYKITYKEGGVELIDAPVGVTTAHNENKKAEMLKNIMNVIPGEKLQDVLQNTANEGASYLTDTVKARADALQNIHDKLVKENNQDFLAVGKFKANHQQAAEISKKKSLEGVQGLTEADLKNKLVRDDALRNDALDIMHSQLRSRAGEVFYNQPFTELSHAQASEWLKKPPLKVDKAVKESADSGRLQKKFERKLSFLVSKNTPPHMVDSMQDVVIESSRTLSEYFVASNYKALAADVLISEMQKRGNEILVEVDGAVETFFFAAQRLKRKNSMEIKEPCFSAAYIITKKLDDIIKCRSMPRKLISTMKDHVKTTADHLSELVTKPDDYIEAYISLLNEMEATGNTLLIEDSISKSYKEAATYLRQLTSFEDQINRDNSSLKLSIQKKLISIMANVTARSYTKSAIEDVIANCAKLLVSYVMLQGEKTQVLKIIISQMEDISDNVFLRHGSISKTYAQAAKILQGFNIDRSSASHVDPVAARKIQIKLNTLMIGKVPEKYIALIDDIIEDTTAFLALQLLRPQVIQVCKCMKNVLVQCELYCDEILRRVSRPSCTCSRHVSKMTLQDIASSQHTQINSDCKGSAFGIKTSIIRCPAKVPPASTSRGESTSACPAHSQIKPCKPDTTTSYQLYSVYDRQFPLGQCVDNYCLVDPSFKIHSNINQLPESCNACDETSLESVLVTRLSSDLSSYSSFRRIDNQSSDKSTDIYYTPPNTLLEPTCPPVKTCQSSKATLHINDDIRDSSEKISPLVADYPGTSSPIIQGKAGFSSRTPIVTTDQMSDWHAMMISCLWNIQAWREWIDECIKSAINYSFETYTSSEEYERKWTLLYRKISTEALQWRQYNYFSRQLATRLSSRYSDKQIVSPTRATVKTRMYRQCQLEMLDIINMLYKWTRWLNTVVKETNSLEFIKLDIPLHAMRWNHFKKKVEEYLSDWYRYTMHLNNCLEQISNLFSNSEGLPILHQSGPVWVVSAYGAVPSGAIAAGVYEGEMIWVARTTHKSNVLPAALHPSKHCCLVYADRSVYHYSKYQIMCNAKVTWVAWRAGEVGARAVKVAPSVYIGRVLYRGSHLLGAVHAPTYRCHVIIFGRPFAFNCYELLVLQADNG